MAAPLLSHVLPVFSRSIGAVGTSLPRVASRQVLRPPRKAGFSTSRPRPRPDTYTSNRYGTANEPPPHLRQGDPTIARDSTDKQAALPKPKEEDAKSGLKKAVSDSTMAVAKEEAKVSQSVAKDSPQAAAETTAIPSKKDEGCKPQDQQGSALSTILHMAAPLSEQEQKPPHLQTPPYVHHFDTHTLVRSLQDGGFTEDQSISLMKAVRVILADNMELAQKGLVSKADAEMESYLFRAASAELRSEIQSNRRINTDKMRTERAQLQHEFDLLSQRSSGDASNLKDDLKGMFDDRKMQSRMERRKMEGIIQEINYKITVALNSDTRSEIEGLRWVLTRRTVFALASIVFMVLASLRYASYMEQKQERERKKMEKLAAAEQGSFAYDGSTPTASQASVEDASALVSLG